MSQHAGRRLTAVLAPLLAALLVAMTPGGASAAAAAADARPGGKLFAGGTFTEAGGTVANNIAAWDGVDWSALTGPAGEGTDDQVSAMVLYNGKLIVGGSFIEAGGVPVSGIASWDGTTWAPLTGASGIPGVTVAPLGFVSSLAVYNGDLYVGGYFPRAGGTQTVHNLARWNGTEWSPVTGPAGFGTENNGSDIAPIWDLAVHNGALIVGGNFTSAGGVPANSVARWDGATWSAVGMPALNDLTVLALEQHNGMLVATRSYVGDNVSVHDVARLTFAGQWAPLLSPSGAGLNGEARDLTVYNGQLIAGGFFTGAGGVPVNHVAAWDGTRWSALAGPTGTGTSGDVYALTVHQGQLIVGGFFATAGGVPVRNIARWNGATWAALPGSGRVGVNNAVFELLST
ncbi:MAG TPA: hypothetical protein VES42_00530 [Pilimelia sp.]|nr:hypothetical protein [Pilimelia sp.]